MDEAELRLRGQIDFLERREAELAFEEARLPTVGYQSRIHQKVQEALFRVQEELEVAKGALKL